MRWLMMGSSAYYTIILAHQCPIRHYDWPACGVRWWWCRPGLPNTDKEELRQDSLEILHALSGNAMEWVRRSEGNQPETSGSRAMDLHMMRVRLETPDRRGSYSPRVLRTSSPSPPDSDRLNERPWDKTVRR